MNALSHYRETDNRDLQDMIQFLEARCDALSRRVHELERENAELRLERPSSPLRLDPGEPLEPPNFGIGLTKMKET